ncbi:MAG: serine hydrolase, partial [Actinobacteria bacterium]|nr:serine hydrolase [Actinomycetota bacterium]
MIENSDNTAGYELFEDVGGYSGRAAAATRLGLTETAQGISDPACPSTSASDCIQLLRQLTGNLALDAASRDYALGLMRDVESDQRWGVGAAGDGTDFANKNGWLSVDNDNAPSEDDDDLWIVNSVGIIDVGGHQVLMAVLTEHEDDLDDGIAAVQQLATLAAAAVR